MITKWVTPLFLSVLSFMVNTQNVCAVCKQGQEQSSSEAFQTNLTTTSSLRNSEIVHPPIDSLENLLSKWDTLLLEVQRQETASNEDFQLFTNFNRSYIDSEWSALFQLIKYRKVNYGNIASYLTPQKEKLQDLYTRFIQIKQEYPNSVESFRHPAIVAPLPLGCNPACTNMDFATGNFTGWTGYYAANNSTTLAHVITGVTGGVLGAVVRGAQDPATSNTYQMHITSSANNDWFLSNYHSINMSQASPWGNGYSAMIGDSINNGEGMAILSQEFQVTPTTNSITYAYSVFLENPAHNYYQQPFFSVVLFDQNGDTIQNCGVYTVVSGSNIPGFTGEYYPPDNRETSGGAGGDTIYWKPWTQVNVPLTNYVGQCVTIQFEVGDCGLGGHSGYAYVDASCSTFTITAASPVICGNGTDLLTGPAGETHYVWTGPANSIISNDTLQKITVDSAGTYTLVITPVTGGLCKDTLTINISRDQLTATASSTTINCNGGTGNATASAQNGIAPYAYLWVPSAQTNAAATGLSAGMYSVTITDANGCSATASTTINQAPLLTAAATTLINVNCNGGSNGSASVIANGGTSPYLYAWNPSAQTNATATGLSAGTYIVTVTDANGCTATATATITQPLLVLSAATNITANVSCNGGSNGSVSVTTNGGTSPYLYLWNPSAQTNATATGLSAGTYTVTVTDAHGCTTTASATIIQPLLALSAATTTLINVSCNGGSNGSVSVTANGGTSPYLYLWNPSAQTNATATGLSAGTYTVTVTDAHGCTTTASATIIQPLLALSAATTTLINVSCNGGSNGSASVTANGGTSPYLYAWNPSAQTNATATGLSAGTYTVTVTDAHGCTATASATITQPLLALSAVATTSSNENCNGDHNGSASINANGGTGPYNYRWNPSGQISSTATGLSAGTYTVTVTDTHGCSTTASVSITQPVGLHALTSTLSNVNCNGNTNGSAHVNIFGGTGPYNYLWNPSVQTNATATELSAGIYTVTVTDTHGCITIQNASITEPSVLSLSLTGTQKPLCEGQPATIDAVISGGTLPYNYLWSNSATTSAITVTPLSTVTYTVSITDANGCSATTTTTLMVTPFVVLIGQNTSICPGQSTNLVVTPSGGDGQYTFTWLPGNNSNQLIIVAPTITTTYTAIVTDGCNATDTVYETITVNPLPDISFGTDITRGCAPLCVQFKNYTSISSGNIAQWDWDLGDGTSENSESAIHCYTNPGNYTVTLTATSSFGCSASATKADYITVYGTPIAAFIANPQPTTISNPVIQFTNQTSNRDTIINWYWTFGVAGDSNTSYINSPFHRYKDTGTYRATLTIMNNHGCVDSVAHDVVIGPDFTLYFPNAFTPNGDGLNDYFFAKGTYVKDFEMYIYDRWGQKIFHTTDVNERWDGRRAGGDMCQEDVYDYIATASDVSGNIYKYSGRVTLLK